MKSFSIKAVAAALFAAAAVASPAAAAPRSLDFEAALPVGACPVAASSADSIALSAPAVQKALRGDELGRTRRRGWRLLIPTHAVGQYAGSIGAGSFGAGWEDVRRHFNIEALLGFVPAADIDWHAHTTGTLRGFYTPWHVNLRKLPFRGAERLEFQPFAVGLQFNWISGQEFWATEPKGIYGGAYYRFSSRFRFGLTLGEQLEYQFPRSSRSFVRAIGAYYQFVLTDLNAISAAPNLGTVGLWDALTVGLGVRVYFR